MKESGNRCFLLRLQPAEDWPRSRWTAYYAYRVGLLFCAGFCMGLVLLALAIGSYPRDVLHSYFRHGELLVLNALPVALLVLLLYAATGRPWSAFLAGGGIAFGFSLGNYYKLMFRDDPLCFADMLILREAGAMASGDHYALAVGKRIAAVGLCLLLGTVLLGFFAPGKLRRSRHRAAGAAAVLALSAALAPVYLSDGLYDAVDNFQRLDHRSPTQNYVAHGFVYPFLHSIGGVLELPPPGYSAGKAEALLSAYQDADIPEDRKVSVIALMREAYVDFSRYGIEGLDAGGYDIYHALEAESYTGNLVTNIFAGGTVDTERCFLTGNYKLHDFRCDANSYVWYLRSQGYAAEGSHPYNQWFYNRQNINGYLGFSRYRFLEGDYEYLTQAKFPEDSVLLPEILADFQAAAGAPYFSFSVNVQSHGPYVHWKPAGGGWLSGNYSDECKNAMNHYLEAIWDTDRQLAWLVEQLREDPAPVVLVTFGDHLPWMGDGNMYYDEMGMDVEADTSEGFYRRYSTRYLIWANNAARKILGHSLQGEGPDISPCYLMNLLFQQLGWEGPGFMQAMDDMREVFPIAGTTGWTMTDGVLSERVPAGRTEDYRNFQYLQHYWRNTFFYQSVSEIPQT